MSVNDLEYEDLLHFVYEYNFYVMDFDYKNSGQPVSIHEFYENEYQEIIKD